MKNAFYLILKVLFILKMFKFLVLTLWSCRENGLTNSLLVIFHLHIANIGVWKCVFPRVDIKIKILTRVALVLFV